jgi:RimJ/RimL family protein N-acetyltransferase
VLTRSCCGRAASAVRVQIARAGPPQSNTLGPRDRSMLPANLGVVVVRYLADSDHDAYIALEKDPDAKRYVGGPSTRSLADLKSELSRYTPSSSLLAIADSTTDKYIGRCGLLPRGPSNEAEIYCVLEKAYWGKGIGEAVTRLLIQLAKYEGKYVIAILDRDNTRSLRMMQRLQWKQVGVVSEPGKQFNHLIFQPRDG